MQTKEQFESRKPFILVISTLVIGVFVALAPFAPSLFAEGQTKTAPSATPLPEELETKKSDSLTSEQYLKIIDDVFQVVQDYYVDDVDAKVLYEGAIKGLMDSLGDPYSVYLDEAFMSDLNDTTQGSFGGVGLVIGKQAEDPENKGKARYIEVVSPVEDTPGWKAGIRSGDLIIKIDGVGTADLTTDQAVKRIRGTQNTQVTITLRRGEESEFDVTLTRAKIEVPNLKKAMMPNGIAYLRIIEFTPQTPIRVREALEYFKQNKYTSLVIDLRNNPGGLLLSCVQIADMFLDSGTIVSTKSRLASENRTDKAKADLLVPKDIPIVILINKGSASASEILSGALKDHKRAYLVGEKTYGKGSVQQVIPIPPGTTGFKLTMSRYYTPSDVNIDKIGIPPDREVKSHEYTEAEIKTLTKLISAGTVSAYALKNPQAGSAEINALAKKLKAEGYDVDIDVLARFIRDEVNRRNPDRVYDLEFDTQLKEAVSIIQNENFAKLVSSVKTLKVLQDEAKAKAEADALETKKAGD